LLLFMKKDISIIIPVYNEVDNIVILLRELKEMLNNFVKNTEIIFIDDGSSDGSYDLLSNLKKNGEDIKIMRFSRNFGQTAAIAAGFEYASGDIIVTMDSDLQNDPKDIPRLIAELEKGYDIVSGWRKDRKDPFWTRRLPSYFANVIISWYTGVKLHDYGCTLKAYRRDLFNDIQLYGELHRFIPALMSWTGARKIEIPVNHRPRKFGQSKYGLSRTLNVILDLITVKFLLISSKGPMRIFGRLGMWSLLMGILGGFATFMMKILMGIDMSGNALFILSVLFIIMSLQFISIGLLGEINIRIYSKSYGKKIYVIKEAIV